MPLKALLQWAAASQCRRQLKYFPFDVPIGQELEALSSKALEHGATVGQLMAALCEIRRECQKPDTVPRALEPNLPGRVPRLHLPKEAFKEHQLLGKVCDLLARGEAL